MPRINAAYHVLMVTTPDHSSRLGLMSIVLKSFVGDAMVAHGKAMEWANHYYKGLVGNHSNDKSFEPDTFERTFRAMDRHGSLITWSVLVIRGPMPQEV